MFFTYSKIGVTSLFKFPSMSRILPAVILCFVCISTIAQKPSRNQALAITSGSIGSFDYSEIKLVDVHSGEVIKSLFQKANNYRAISAKTKNILPGINERSTSSDSLLFPMATMVGGAAYDAKHNRLFYTPLGVNQLRYIDLSAAEPTFTFIDDAGFGTATGPQDRGAQIARMVIDPKGNGYGLSNDGNHLVRFTTNDKIAITDMGALVDDPKDSTHGYRTACSCISYGGDMVADENGDLVLITGNNNIYKIAVNTKTISFVGVIKGLPEGFTSNGAAVDDEGQLIVSCAISTVNAKHPYYTVDLKTLKATALEASKNITNTADLATSNFLSVGTKEKIQLIAADFSENIIANDKISIFPNPVEGDRFKISFRGVEKGDYKIRLFDMNGRAIAEKDIRIVSNKQDEEVSTSGSNGVKGNYMVNVISRKAQKAVYNQQIIIQ
jgi:hypothetical protein